MIVFNEESKGIAWVCFGNGVAENESKLELISQIAGKHTQESIVAVWFIVPCESQSEHRLVHAAVDELQMMAWNIDEQLRSCVC
jgi:hypothetical protein